MQTFIQLILKKFPASPGIKQKTPQQLLNQSKKQKKSTQCKCLLNNCSAAFPSCIKHGPSLDGKKGKESLVAWRNHEMSSSVNSLEPLLRFPTTTVLQEYFIPLHQLTLLLQRCAHLLKHMILTSSIFLFVTFLKIMNQYFHMHAMNASRWYSI